jgi:hypothetical protein
MGRFHYLGGVMAIVFVTNHDPNIDYRGLGKYADAVTNITAGKSFPETYDHLIDDIVQKLLLSESTDYLCPTGDNVITALCSAIWVQMHTQLNLIVIGEQGVYKCSVNRTDLRLKAEKFRDLLTGRR